MMRKTGKWFALCTMLLCLCSCQGQIVKEGWKTVSVPNAGQFAVPDEWLLTVDKKGVFFTDAAFQEETKPRVFMAATNIQPEQNTPNLAEVPDWFGDFSEEEVLSSNGLSNITIWGKRMVLWRQETKAMDYIEFFSEKGARYCFYFFEEGGFTEEEIAYMAQSFTM